MTPLDMPSRTCNRYRNWGEGRRSARSAARRVAAGLAMDSGAHRVYEFSGFRLDPRRRRLERIGGDRVVVTPTAFDVLVYLVEHAGELVPRSALVKAVWPTTIVEENNVSKAVSVLRRVIGNDAIVTIPRRGYQFTADVRCVAPEPFGTPQAVVGRRGKDTEAVAARPSRAGRTIVLRTLLALALVVTLLVIGVTAVAAS